jgi:single-strand DNA-binding protein
VNEPYVQLTGNLAAKPQLRVVPTLNGTAAVADLRVAVTPRRKERGADDWSDGETMWFKATAWRSLAQNCVASLNQGDRVVVTGRLTQRTWTDADGGEHPTFEVAADSISLDLARNAALAIRRPPAQRQDEPSGELGEERAADERGDDERTDDERADDDGWVSSGRVDQRTGEVTMTRPDAPDEQPVVEDAVPV